MRWIALAALAAAASQAAELRPDTVAAFDRYVRQAEQRLDRRKTFLWASESPERTARVQRGEIAIDPLVAKGDMAVPSGLIHDWVGAVFVPGATLEKTLSLMEDYNHKTYHHEVVESRILARAGNHFKVYMRLLKKKVITVVLATDHDVEYFPIDRTHARSVSRTTRIAEINHPGKPDEREEPPGTGQGFLWKLNTYWRFEEGGGGTWIECEAISLTRDVPTGLGWLIEPIIRTLPRESLESTLGETRSQLMKE